MHNHHHSHNHDHDHHKSHTSETNEQSNFLLALSATLHCLLGCGLGEVVGMIISTWLGLSMTNSTIVAIVLGFVFGLGLGVMPLLRKKFSLSSALKTVVIAEGLSIVVMEGFEVYVQILIPGVMEAGLSDSIFWLGMLAGLAAGFVAALPVNYILVKRGVRHVH